MNERIKQLAKEAGYYLYDLTETHECKTVETDSKDEWITLEKFAELIVKECAKIVDQYISDCGEIGILPDYVLNEPFGIK